MKKLLKLAVIGATVVPLLFAGSGTVAGIGQTQSLLPPPARAINQSTPTRCAEEDNVNVAFLGQVVSFVVEATHPTYVIGPDNCAADFTNCPVFADPVHWFTPGTFKLFDDGETVVEAVRKRSWWRPTGMTVSVDTGSPATDIHYVRLYRKIADADSWPQFFVLYMDGNMRLKPHPPAGRDDTCFGSSVIIGPAPISPRPIAEIVSVKYVSRSKTMEVHYKNGGSAILNLREVNRAMARVRVTVNYPTGGIPFTAFRSMFVTDGNADVDRVQWKDAFGNVHDEAIMEFKGGEGREWFFYRRVRSRHNTSAPDIRVRLDQ